MKKSYNPFKMWGAWIGALPGLIMSLLMLFGIKKVEQAGGELSLIGLGITIWLFIMVIGFLIGWGIHSLIRKLQ